MDLINHLVREVQLVLNETPRMVMQDRRSAIRRGVMNGSRAALVELNRLVEAETVPPTEAGEARLPFLDPLLDETLLARLSLPPHLGFPQESAADALIPNRPTSGLRRVQPPRARKRPRRARPD
jgi:hypothetical protein